MIRRIIYALILAAIALAFYKIAGGDLSMALQTAWDIIVLIVTKLSDVFVYIIKEVSSILN